MVVTLMRRSDLPKNNLRKSKKSKKTAIANTVKKTREIKWPETKRENKTKPKNRSG